MSKNLQQLYFKIGMIDALTGPMGKICGKVNQLHDLTNRGFDTMRNGFFGMLAAGAGLQKLVAPAQEFNQAINEVASLGVAQKELEKLGDIAKGYVMDFGGDVTAVVRSAYDIQSAIMGLADGELASFTRAANITATATKASAGDMTSYMGTMYGIFEEDAKNIGKARWADELMGKTAKAVQMFKTTGPGMSAAFTNIGSDAQKMGISLNEQIGVLGTLQATMGGERAGSSYAAFVRAIPNADKFSKTTGLSFKDAAGNAKPIYEVVGMLEKKYGHLDKLSRARVIQRMFGSSEAVKVVNNLWGKTDGLKQSIDELAKTKGLDFAEKMANTIKTPLDRLLGAFQIVWLELSQKIMPIMDYLFTELRGIGKWIYDFMKTNKTLTTVLAIITAGIFGISFAISGIIFMGGLLKMSLGGWAVMWGFIAKVNYRLRWLIVMSKKYHITQIIGTKIQAVWGAVVKAVTGTMAWQNGVIAVQMVKLKLLSYWQKICAFSTTLQNVAYQALIIAMNLNYLGIIKQVGIYAIQKASLLGAVAVMGIIKVATWAITGAQWALNVAMLACPLTWIILGITALIGAIALCVIYWDDIKMASIAAWDAIVTGLSWCWDMLKMFGNWIVGAFVDYFNFWESIGATIFDGLIFAVKWCWDMLKSFGAWLGEIFTSQILTIVDVFNSVWNGLVAGAKWCFSFIQPLFDNILSIWNSIGGIWDKLTGFFGSSSEIDATVQKSINLKNNPNLSADLVRPSFNNKSVSNSINNNNTNYGGVKITVQGGFTPAQMAEWQALAI